MIVVLTCACWLELNKTQSQNNHKKTKRRDINKEQTVVLCLKTSSFQMFKNTFQSGFLSILYSIGYVALRNIPANSYINMKEQAT